MLLGIRGCVFQKARAALLKNRDHRVGNESLGLDDQTEPIGKCSPLDEFGDGLRKTVRRNESALSSASCFDRRPRSSSAFRELAGRFIKTLKS